MNIGMNVRVKYPPVDTTTVDTVLYKLTGRDLSVGDTVPGFKESVYLWVVQPANVPRRDVGRHE
jgi:hypothetical protein